MQADIIKRLAGRAHALVLGLITIAALGIVLTATFAPSAFRSADAAVTNYPPGVAVYAMPIQLDGAFTTVVTPVRFALPFPGRLIGFSASARSISGTMTVDFQAGGSSLLSPTLGLTAGAINEAVIQTSAVADEAVLTVVLTPGGTGPTTSDITVMPTFLRR